MIGPEPWADSSHRSDWFKSSFSNGSQTCVEVRFHGDLVSVRDSKHRRETVHDPHHEPIITITAEEWTTFLDELTGHATERTQRSLAVEDNPGGPLLRATGQGIALKFTHAEWHAYLAGVHAHEFDHPGHPTPRQGLDQLKAPSDNTRPRRHSTAPECGPARRRRPVLPTPL